MVFLQRNMSEHAFFVWPIYSPRSIRIALLRITFLQNGCSPIQVHYTFYLHVLYIAVQLSIFIRNAALLLTLLEKLPILLFLSRRNNSRDYYSAIPYTILFYRGDDFNTSIDKYSLRPFLSFSVQYNYFNLLTCLRGGDP